MSRDSERTKQLLLAAALDEFSAYGIAGARVDRIAAQAGCNKALIYAYFTNKEGLFDAVAAEQIRLTLDEAPIDADDLPGYAVALFDWHLARPELLRLSLWHQLERGADVPPALREANQRKIAAIADAQRRGTVNDEIGAAELLAVLVAISLAGLVEGTAADVPADARDRQRQAVIDSVRALTQPRRRANP